MDGGRRLLRSLGGVGAGWAPASFGVAAFTPRHRIARRFHDIAAAAAATRFLGAGLALVVLGGAAAYGAVSGGAYAEFTTAYGSLPDIFARGLGFRIASVGVSGLHEMSEAQVLRIAGVGPRNSLVFLDVAALRARLTAVPLVKEASVTKLYPDRIVIDIEERQPTALWQKDGVVSLVAADGTPIDDLTNPRYQTLPLVVGESAAAHLPDYLAVLEAAGDLRERVRAGIYVAGRRWTLKFDNNVEVDLPEKDPAAAMTRLVRLERDSHVLEKDVLSLDLRMADRAVVRLGADAIAARADAAARKTLKKKGATT